MDFIESAGKVVLLSYGQFLDILGTELSILKESFPTFQNVIRNPVGVEIDYKENSYVCDLVETDSVVQNKILIVFTTLCKEVNCLEQEVKSKYLPHLTFYGEGCLDQLDEDESRLMASELLPLLLDVLAFVRRCRTVLIHFLQQLSSTYSFPWKSFSTSDLSSRFQEVFNSLGVLLSFLVGLDVVFTNNSVIEAHFKLLKQSITSCIANSSHDIHKLKGLSKIMNEVYSELFTGQIFQNSVHVQFERKMSGQCSVLTNPFNSYLKARISEIESRKEMDCPTLVMWSNVVICYVFSAQMFGVTDRRLHKLVLDMSKKNATALLFSDVLWFPSDFLAKQLENRSREQQLRISQNESALHSYLDQTGAKLLKEVKMYALQTFKWTLQMENSVSIDSMYMSLSDTDSIQLCFEGIHLANQIKYLVNYISNLHSTLGKPMTKTSALALCKLVELLKGIQSVFMRHQILIAKCLNHSIQKLVAQILNLIQSTKRDLIKDKSCSNSNVDSYHSLILAEKLLFGACTEDRLLLTKLALSITTNLPLLHNGQSLLSKYFSKLQSMFVLREKLEEATTCHFLFTESQILSIYLRHLMDSQSDLSRMQYILSSWEDSCSAVFSRKDTNMMFNLTREQLQSKVLKQLCQEVETNLRLQVHSHLQIESSTPENCRDYRQLLRGSPILIFNNLFSVKGQIEIYLDKTFYDLTTVALHDWHTYKKMRSLAEYKFSLVTVEDNLPSQALSQGLDVLEIMRNINIFVSKYLYNLNNQCFIEFSSNNKHLNTINIGQIANSIWTHGIGIMNTTANFIYQFLRKKLLIFSQFLYDDNIKSRLMKDLNFFVENKSHHRSIYPYDRAEKFNKGISRLGVTQTGLTYLDQFRILISQIGNALGYVRMVRAGGLHHCLGASGYLPSLEMIHLSTEFTSRPVADSVSCFYQILSTMLHNLTEGTEYFKLLVDVFSSVFCSPENNHLKLFVMIIPPLTINFVHYIVAAKDKMNKRSRDGALFTDDGFAMGIAYLLRVLNLYQEFDSLHWFDSVRLKYQQQESVVTKHSSNERKEDKHENTLKLSIKRLQMYKQEFDLLKYNLNSARVFFTADQVPIPGI